MDEFGSPIYEDRATAGRELAELLREYEGSDAVVLALPRGGVVVGFEVAVALGLELDVLVVKKLGAPGHEELGIGAIAASGVRVLNSDLVRDLGLSEEAIDDITAREFGAAKRRQQLYRSGRPEVNVQDRTVLLVDDGLATGATMAAGVRVLRRMYPKQVVVAVPVSAPQVAAFMRGEADRVVCPHEPEPFHAVGVWYRNFHQTTDDEVRHLLQAASVALSLRK